MQLPPEPGAAAQADTAKPDVLDVWPEHWVALQLLLRCIGQFELALGPATAHYGCAQAANVKQHMAWLQVPPDQEPSVAADYLVMEREALRVMNERVADAARRR